MEIFDDNFAFALAQFLACDGGAETGLPSLLPLVGTETDLPVVRLEALIGTVRNCDSGPDLLAVDGDAATDLLSKGSLIVGSSMDLLSARAVLARTVALERLVEQLEVFILLCHVDRVDRM